MAEPTHILENKTEHIPHEMPEEVRKRLKPVNKELILQKLKEDEFKVIGKRGPPNLKGRFASEITNVKEPVKVDNAGKIPDVNILTRGIENNRVLLKLLNRDESLADTKIDYAKRPDLAPNNE